MTLSEFVQTAFIVLPLTFISFGVAWFFIVKKLSKEFTNPSQHATLLFSTSFSTSLFLFQLLLFDILLPTLFPATARLLYWRIAICLTLLHTLVFVPGFMVWLVMDGVLGRFGRSDRDGMGGVRGRVRVFGVVLGWSLFFYCFWKVGTQLPRDESLFSVEAYTGRVGVIGVTIVPTTLKILIKIALLSGFGSVHGPYTSISLFIQNVGKRKVVKMQRRLNVNIDLTFTKKKRLQLERTRQPQSTGFFNRVLTNVSSGLGINTELTRGLESEIRALTRINEELLQELDEAHSQLERSEWSKTFTGRYVNCIGYILSLYGTWKIIITFINLLFNRRGTIDPITHAIDVFIHLMGIQIDISFWSQHLSFLFIGCIVLFSLRGLLLQFLKVARLVSKRVSTDFIVLLLAQIMGSYALSTVIMLRTSLPPQYRSIISKVLGKIEFGFYHRWFDKIYLVSAVGYLGVIWSVERYRLKERQRDEEEKY